MGKTRFRSGMLRSELIEALPGDNMH
jgi:hypothetical protein